MNQRQQLESILNDLCEACIAGRLHLDTARELEAGLRAPAMNPNPFGALLWHTVAAHSEASLTHLARVVDKTANTLSLQDFLSRLETASDLPPNLAPAKKNIPSDRASLDSLAVSIDRLRDHRNARLAHFGKQLLNHGGVSGFKVAVPLDPTDLAKLYSTIAAILTKYYRIFFATDTVLSLAVSDGAVGHLLRYLSELGPQGARGRLTTN